MKNLIQNYKFHVLVFIISLVSLFFVFSLIDISHSNQRLKADSAEVKSIKYGLFSINQWKNQLYLIISDQIHNMDIKGNRRNIKPIVEAQLDKLIDSVDQKIRKKNSESLSGRFKQAFINTFVDLNDIKQGIPQYADEIIQVMQKEKVKRKVQTVLQGKVENYFDNTFQDEDVSALNGIVERTKASGVEDARVILQEQIARNNRAIAISTFSFLIFAMVIFLLVSFYGKRMTTPLFFTLVIVLLALLITGVSIPMIDLEAKISEMSFVLLNHPVKFTDQIIYFQSKSVLDVFMVMVTHPELQMKIVGILIVMFSVVFPLLKILSAIVFYFDFKGLKENKLIQFFVLKSGKWSMTDVLIIAIFMAYIGFNGIISSQLDGLSTQSESLMILATNGTALQSGFFLFFGYAILAMVFSELLVQKEYSVLVTKSSPKELTPKTAKWSSSFEVAPKT